MAENNNAPTNTVPANPPSQDWTEGLSEDQRTFVTEKGFKTPGDVLSAWPKDAKTWTDFLSPEERGAVESKGFKDPGSLLSSYLNLEKLKGVPEDRLLKLPEKSPTEDPDSWKGVFQRLGMPEKSDDYQIQVPEQGGADEKTVKWAKDTFHNLGLTKAQGEGFIQKWNEFVNAKAAEFEEQAKVSMLEAEKELKTKWGMAYEKNINVAKMAAKQFGLTEEDAGKMAQVLGDTKFMELFHKIGEGLGEHNFVSGDKKVLGLKSPEAAQHEIKELTQDTEFQKKFAEGDMEARRKWERLHQMAYPA